MMTEELREDLDDETRMDSTQFYDTGSFKSNVATRKSTSRRMLGHGTTLDDLKQVLDDVQQQKQNKPPTTNQSQDNRDARSQTLTSQGPR